jgi:peptidoglycan/LPS O-acetylase OafA/YrhL
MLLADRLKDRRNNFDFLRFTLAATVIFTHSYNLVPGQVMQEPLLRLTHGQTAAATIAVNFFFLISGLLIAQSWETGKSLRSYLMKRVLRIYPAFAVATVVAIVLSAPFAAQGMKTYLLSHKTYEFIPRQLLFHRDALLWGAFAHSGTPSLPLGSLATLRYEVGCYLLVPLVAGIFSLWRSRAFVATAIISWIAFAVSPTLGAKVHLPFFGDLHYFPRVLVYFAVGSTCWYFRHRVIFTGRIALASMFALLVATHFGFLNLALPIFGSYLLLYVAMARIPHLDKFGSHGDISYGVFIYGYLVQQILIAILGPRISPTALTLMALPLTCGFAAMSWVFVEHPFLRLKGRLKDKNAKPNQKAPSSGDGSELGPDTLAFG